jgi:hypothetical protein
LCGGLKGTANHSEYGGEEEPVDTANAICSPTANKSTKDSAEVVLQMYTSDG